MVHVSAEQKDSEWVFSVRDNGIGFDPKYAAAIFTPFKRLHTAEEYPGTGVGLAICRRIVQAQAGRIWAESVPGEGTTFFFTLPVEPLAIPKHTAPIDSPAPQP
jgi:light-regulated signal transduction histidine kinase (bacteriophytochrome)